MNVYAYDSLWTVKNNHRQYASEKKLIIAITLMLTEPSYSGHFNIFSYITHCMFQQI